MRSIKIYLVALSVLALTVFTMPMSAQNPQYPSPDYPFPGFPQQFSPLRTSRPRAKDSPRLTTKFLEAAREGIANQYIVTLDGKAVAPTNSREEMRRNVLAIANSLVAATGGKVGFVYANGGGPKGFSVNMPESAAISLSQDPQVSLVEQDRMLHVLDTQMGAPWDLDRIDEMARSLQGNYVYNATGSGVVAYVLDTGIRSTHVDFQNRAYAAADFINEAGCTGINNDCHPYGHGTAVASVVGGSTYGVSKGVTIKSVKVCDSSGNCPTSAVVNGLNWVIGDSASTVAVVNMSIGNLYVTSINTWTQNAINAGITCVAAAGDLNTDVANSSPATVVNTLSVGASDYYDSRWINSGSSASNYGASLDIFAPGFGNVAACNTYDTCVGEIGATSGASPIGAGLASLYLQNRTAMSGCPNSPIDGPANTYGGAVSGCPDRVNQFIKSNATLSQLSNIPTGTANRLVYSASLPTTTNPIDNQRFFVWQHYADFLVNEPEPDEGGLDFWTRQITDHCGTSFNDNDACTDLWRVLTSRTFWVASHEPWFTSSYGLAPSDDPSEPDANARFIRETYRMYLRREADAPGYNFWYNDLSNWGNPANQDGVLHMISAFVHSGVPDGYRQRFGAP